MKASDGSRHQVTESSEEKDLDVLVQNQMSFKHHVARITSVMYVTTTSKANGMIGGMRRLFDYL